MYKEKVTPKENHGALAFLAVILGILIYIIGFGIIGMFETEFKWIFHLIIYGVLTYIAYFMYTRLMGDYYYIIDDGRLICISQTNRSVKELSNLPIDSIVSIGEYTKENTDCEKVINAVKSFSKKNVKTAVFIIDEKKYILHFEPTDELIRVTEAIRTTP